MSRSRRSPWLLAGFGLVGALATRAVWLAAAFYLGSAPRFPLESAAIALVVVGTIVVCSRTGDPTAVERHDRGLAWGRMPVFVAASFILFAPALGLGLLSDDYVLRAAARAGPLASMPGPFFRPVPLIIWRLFLAIGDSAVLLHAFNVALHGVNACLVAVLAMRLGLRRDAALAAGALFVAFPAAPEAVAWCSGIQDVLLTTCALGAVIAAGTTGPVATAVAAVLIVVALGSKETAICIPVLIGLCWFSPHSMRRRDRWLPAAVFLGIVVLYGLIRLSMGIDARYVAAPSRYLVKQLLVTAFGTLAAPWRAPSSAALRWLAFDTSAVLTALLVHAFITWRRTDASFHLAVRLTLWVIAAVAPVFTLFFVSPTLEGSRYVYLAECGWALLVADLLSTGSHRVRHRTVALTCAATLAVAVSVVMLERELGVWSRAAAMRDHVLLEARQAAASARCATAHFDRVPDSVAGAYVFRNGFPEALSELGIAVAADAAPGCEFTWSGDTFVGSAR